MVDIVIVLTLQLVLLFFLSRGLMVLYLSTRIKKRRYRVDRTKGQSAWDWFTYKRFWDVISKKEVAFLVYWGNFALYLLLLMVAGILSLFYSPDQFREVLCSLHLILIANIMGIRFATLGGFQKNRRK